MSCSNVATLEFMCLNMIHRISLVFLDQIHSVCSIVKYSIVPHYVYAARFNFDKSQCSGCNLSGQRTAVDLLGQHGTNITMCTVIFLLVHYNLQMNADQSSVTGGGKS